ncbi:MAG: hypothetical protein IIW46_02065, partial [Bacteroidaceae bacterium]|nr:hypothetical protein [Bacteroidaceae bacterium]
NYHKSGEKCPISPEISEKLVVQNSRRRHHLFFCFQIRDSRGISWPLIPLLFSLGNETYLRFLGANIKDNM